MVVNNKAVLAARFLNKGNTRRLQSDNEVKMMISHIFVDLCDENDAKSYDIHIILNSNQSEPRDRETGKELSSP